MGNDEAKLNIMFLSLVGSKKNLNKYLVKVNQNVFIEKNQTKRNSFFFYLNELRTM